MKKEASPLIFCIIFILLSSLGIAATISGSVYDLELRKADGVIVTIDTEPIQNMVVSEGSYSFEVIKGEYTIIAKQYESGEVISYVKENITVSNEGNYVIDLILFPSFEEEQEIIDEIESEDLGEEVGPVFTESSFNLAEIIALILVLAVLGYFAYLFKKRADKRADEMVPDLADDVLDFIKKEGGRVNQKEIRKNFPQSEAKISLIITELESLGKVKKIKQGRGNIVVLNKGKDKN